MHALDSERWIQGARIPFSAFTATVRATQNALVFITSSQPVLDVANMVLSGLPMILILDVLNMNPDR